MTQNLLYAAKAVLRGKFKKEVPRGKEEGEKVSLKLNIQQSKIMASGPITS